MFKEEFVQFYPQPKSWASSKFKSALIDISILLEFSIKQNKNVLMSYILTKNSGN